MIRERKLAELLMQEIRRFIPHEADCYSFICDFYSRCYGISLPRYEYSQRQETPPDRAWEDWQPVSSGEKRPGDVVMLYSDMGLHIGIMLDNGDFVHCCIGSPPVQIGSLSQLPVGTKAEFVRYRHAHR